MGRYSIFLKESVRKDLSDVPAQELKRIVERIGLLTDDPRPQGCEKLSGQERYRIRQGNYRIIYSIQDAELTVWVVRVGHRREIYR
jgi:mRNA interferase RelE/StbE